MRRYLALVLVVVLGTPVIAQGPGRAGLRSNSATSIGTHWTPSFASEAVSGTHWKEGMLIGGGAGIAVGLLLAAALNGNCFGDTNHCGPSLLGIVGGLTIFSLIGGMIGSGIHKR